MFRFAWTIKVSDDGSRQPKHAAMCDMIVLNGIFSFVSDTGKHKGIHENKIDNHDINKGINSTKFFIIYTSSQKPRVKCKIKKKITKAVYSEK